MLGAIVATPRGTTQVVAGGWSDQSDGDDVALACVIQGTSKASVHGYVGVPDHGNNKADYSDGNQYLAVVVRRGLAIFTGLFSVRQLLSNDSPPLPKNESFSLDHFDDPSLPRPPPEPPDVEICFNFEPDAGVVTKKVVGDISEHVSYANLTHPYKPTLCPDF
ncbi:hypothetical protein Tco_1218395 [Tanacetum coccineum]